MRKFLTTLILTMLMAAPAWAQPVLVVDQATEMNLDTTNFDDVLSSSEDTLQEALDVLDDVTREHATDCTAITDGRSGNICWEKDDNTFYVCEPSIGLCDTPGEWTQISGTGGASQLSDLTDVGTTTATGGNLLIADGTNFDSVSVSGDVTINSNGTVTIGADSVALGTDTTGNYTATIADAGNSTVTVINGTAEGGAVTLDAVDVNCSNCIDGTDIALGSDAQGDVMYYDGTDWARLGAGTNGQFLQTQGAGANPQWASGAGGGASALEDLADVGTTTATSGNLLIADGTNFDSVALGGDATVNQNGTVTIGANAVALGTDTTGNYVATIAAGSHIATTGASTGEGIAHSISVADDFVLNTGDTISGNLTVTGTLTVADIDTSGTVSAAAFSGDADNDPAITFDVATATDTDYWMGACSDNDSVADASDNLEIGYGLTKCTNTMFQFRKDGDITIGDGAGTIATLQYDSSDATYDPRIDFVSTGMVLSGMGESTSNNSRYAVRAEGTFVGGFTGDPYKTALQGYHHYGAVNSTGYGVGVQGLISMENATGTQDQVWGVQGRGTRLTSGGTTTTYAGLRGELASVTAGTLTNNYAGSFGGRIYFDVDADTISDSGDGNPATATLNPSSGYVELTCSDADGCTITMGETGVVKGTFVKIVNVSANACNFADTSGVSETTGAIALGQYDFVEFTYMGDRWAQSSQVVDN